MQREVSLEEWFLMRHHDRPEYLDQVSTRFNLHEAMMRPNIETALTFGRHKRYEKGKEAAIELLSTVRSYEMLASIRRHFTEIGGSEERSQNISMLLLALVVNYNFDYDVRFHTISHYVDNPRYTMTEIIQVAFSDALDLLQYEVQENAQELSKVIHSLSKTCEQAGTVKENMSKWYKGT